MPANIAVIYYLSNTAKFVELTQLIQINSGKVATSMVSASHDRSRRARSPGGEDLHIRSS